jgi:hypothetical protein
MAHGRRAHVRGHPGRAGCFLYADLFYDHVPVELADMKVTKDYTRKDGVRTITVQLAKDEKLMEFKDDSYYRLGGQIDDVVAVHCIIEGKRVYWCSIEQKWVEA